MKTKTRKIYLTLRKMYYVRLVLASCWQAEDGLDVGRFLALAQSVLPMIKP